MVPLPVDEHFSIKVEGLTKTFNREVIVRNFNFNFDPGSSIAITGSNGSGKSTLLKLLAGIILPNKGKITYYNDDRVIAEDQWYWHISFCSPAQELIEEFTLEEMIDFHLKFRSFDNGINKSSFLEKTYFKGEEKKKIGLFSSGMKQRLKLSLALFTASNILLLDEPTTNMDEKGIEWFKSQIISNLNKRLVIVASNQKHEYDFCNEVIGIEDYKLH